MSATVPLLGLETEYGIVRDEVDSYDVVEESMRLVRRCEMKSEFGNWAYSRERSHQDMRGFTVTSLAQDDEEDAFCAEDKKRSYSYWEMKSDRVLENGARFYNDHTHPEYSTPECGSVFQLVAHDLAGERIVAECARLRNLDCESNNEPGSVQIFKNNTDYIGHSYGTHDNYLIARRLPFEHWVKRLVPFLVTRQLYAGAGKVGTELRNDNSFSGLQLTQRSDFIETVLSIETMTQRPIINTRDEPHATANKHRRLHLILGDANMSPYATALKVGATRLVLTLIGEEKISLPVELKNPVNDVKSISRNHTGTVLLQRAEGGTITPLEIQESYLEAVEKNLSGQCKEWDWVIREWTRTLDELRYHPEKLADRIDWAIKKDIFTRFIESENVSWDDPWIKSLDLEYHNLDPERGLYRGLEQSGGVVPMFSEDEVIRAVKQPPEDTRALVRGLAVTHGTGKIKNIHWTGIEFTDGGFIDLSKIVTSADVEHLLSSKKEQYPWL
jgi:proteasome accessory factor A